jgi:hypothetical protein
MKRRTAAAYLDLSLIASAMTGEAMTIEGLDTIVSVSAYRRYVKITTSAGTVLLTPAQASRLSDILEHAAREVQIESIEDVIDHNTLWV